MKNNNKVKNSDNFGKQLLLVILPFYGYLVAFIFEQGYISYFGIPSQLIRITIENIVLAIIGVFSGLSIYIFLSDFIAPIINVFYKGRKNPIMKAVYITSIETIIISAIFLPFLNTTLLRKLLIFLGLALYLSFNNFIIPIIFAKKGLSFSQKLESEDKVVINRISLINIISQGDNRLSLLLIIAVVFLIMSYQAGSYLASTQKDFLSFQINGEKNVIIREYGQKYVAVEIDPETKIIENNITLIPYTTQIKFELEKIGPLKNK